MAAGGMVRALERMPEQRMPRELVDIPLRQSTPGTTRVVRMLRYGAEDARPKAYIHAALHADEAPGMFVAHHLLRLLDEADARGEILGQVDPRRSGDRVER